MSGKSPVTADGEQRAALSVLATSRDRGEADRARAVLLTLSGWTSPRIAEAFGVREDTVRLWRGDSFTLWLDGGGSPGNLEFVVAQWNGTAAVGPALYTGAPQFNAATSNIRCARAGLDGVAWRRFGQPRRDPPPPPRLNPPFDFRETAPSGAVFVWPPPAGARGRAPCPRLPVGIIVGPSTVSL